LRVRFTPSARLQFLEAIAYIRRDKQSAAENFRKRSEKILRRLEKYPESGRMIPEFPGLPHREVVIRPYRFFYRIEKKTIWIVAVWHGAQEIKYPSGSA
jgi:toxin ParE1/3/4